MALYQVDEKRGLDAMGILPEFTGIQYSCTHALCNAYHLREMEGVWDRDVHQWAKKMLL